MALTVGVGDPGGDGESMLHWLQRILNPSWQGWQGASGGHGVCGGRAGGGRERKGGAGSSPLSR